MFALQRIRGLMQRVEIVARPLVLQCLLTARQFQALAIQMIEMGAFDLGIARSRRGIAAVRFPALLPGCVGGFGCAQCFAGMRFRIAQPMRFRFAFGQRGAQAFMLRPVAGDVIVDFLQRVRGLFARLPQAFAEFAVMGDLLFDPRQFGADLIDLGLHRVQRIGIFLMADAPGFDGGLEVALFGQLLFDPGLRLAQGLAMLRQFLRDSRDNSARAIPPRDGCVLLSASSSVRPRAPAG